jgi:hypothetical protein
MDAPALPLRQHITHASSREIHLPTFYFMVVLYLSSRKSHFLRMESSNSEIEVEFDTRNDGVTGPLCKIFPDHGLKTDPNQDDKACEFKLCSVARPYMRSFHYAWWSYHVAFLMWYVLIFGYGLAPI